MGCTEGEDRVFLSHAGALLVKRFNNARRDRKAGRGGVRVLGFARLSQYFWVKMGCASDGVSVPLESQFTHLGSEGNSIFSWL